jgi:hypothetical protein
MVALWFYWECRDGDSVLLLEARLSYEPCFRCVFLLYQSLQGDVRCTRWREHKHMGFGREVDSKQHKHKKKQDVFGISVVAFAERVK